MNSLSDTYDFCHEEADKAVRFIERYCTHVSGAQTGQPIKLESWQSQLVRSAVGMRDRLGRRRYRFIWLEAPKKSGKSTLAAAILLYMLLVDKENNAECCVVASSNKSAKNTLCIVKRMIENDRDLNAVCSVRNGCVYYKSSSLYVVHDAKRVTSGRNISFAVFEEFQNCFSRELYHDVISSASSRDQPLFLCLVAASADPSSIAWELHQYAMKVHKGEILDATWLVQIFGAKDEDDWTSPAVWSAAHPGLGISISQQFLREQCFLALHNSSQIPRFKRTYLNIWERETEHWIDLELWDRCESICEVGNLIGRTCKIGLDLSSTRDLSAVVAVFPEVDGGYAILPYIFCPMGNTRERLDGCGQAYRRWIQEGWIISTIGNVVDYGAIYHKILDLCQGFKVEEIAYDRWGATMLINHLTARGANCIPVNQDASTFSKALQEFERSLREGKLRHDGNPAVRWCASNVVLKEGKNGLLRPSKRKSGNRIDPIVAALLAMNRYVVPTCRDADIV